MRRLLRFALFVLVFGLGLALGGWLSIRQRAAEFSAGVDRQLAEGSRTNREPVPSAKVHFATEEDLVTAVMSAVTEEDMLLRAYRLREVLSNLDSKQLGIVFERILRVDDRERRSAVLIPLLARWMSLDPAAAAAAVQPYRDRVHARGRMDWRSIEVAVNDAWARAFPEIALNEAMANPDASWSSTAAWAALNSLGGGDPAQQLALLSKMPQNRLRDQLCISAIGELAKKDYAAAEAQLALIPDARSRNRVQADILAKLAARDAPAALAKMAELAPGLGSGVTGAQLVGAVLRAAAKTDPKAALAAIDGLPEALRSQARGATLVGWADAHPVDALEWAAANGVAINEAKAIADVGDFGASWYSLISTAMSSDREKTLEWVLAQPASTARDNMLQSGLWNGSWEKRLEIFNELTPAAQKKGVWPLLRGFGETSLSSAEPWVNELPPGPTRTAAVQSLTQMQIEQDESRIESAAAAWPAGPERDAALRGISNAVSDEDPRRAMEFARRISNPTTRFHTFSQLAGMWLRNDEAAARNWIATAPEFTADERRVLIRQFEEQ